ncbi:MAG: hypothetical protein CFH19_00119 [Alphaproteobacteria bacterium MarineAlpha5_Bin9]|nr:MAG: hypothetical protein CFH19_00119 [Alphaproteobacteria bacterium MarineAlpha5_Bin9]|tara:strand:+ start:5504 stop:6733 length:1230 start_codon:yes stop_codon:yes gene_type:complete
MNFFFTAIKNFFPKKFIKFDPKLLFYGFSIIFFASYGQTFFISIFNQEIRIFYNLSDGQFGLIYALGTLFSSLCLVFFAKLIDTVDLRIYSFSISLGLALTCLSFYILNNSLFFLFIIIFLLRFFGQGAMAHAGETTMARYFEENRGKAISFATFGGQIGVMILPILTVTLLKVFTWSLVWIIAGTTILFIFLPLLFFLLNDQKERHFLFLKKNKISENNKKLKILDILSDKKFYLYLPTSIAAPFISTGLMFHQVFIINQKGWTMSLLATGFVFLGIFSIAGLFVGGPIIDKFNTKKIVILTHIPLFFGILILLTFNDYVFLFFYLSLFGFHMGISFPIIGSLWAELYDLESLGTIKGILHASAVFASALSPLIFGFSIDLGFGVFTLCLISLLIIIFSTFLAYIAIK